jgi:phage protein D
MDFVQAEKRYQNFYAPVAKVFVEGDNLLKMGIELTSVTVDNTLEGADQFSFVVNNAFDLQKRDFRWLDEVFAFGKRVRIEMGYVDQTVLMVLGLITEIKTGFPSGSLPQITVSGFDLSYCMGRGKVLKHWDEKTDSFVITEIANKHGLTPVVKDTRVKHPRIEQSQESDLEFITKLAGRNGFELYVFDETLYCQPPFNDKDASFVFEWGHGLTSFTPEINISEQITEVEVLGWDVNTKKEIVGKAKAGQEPGRAGNRKSGGEVIKSICRAEPPVHRVRQPVYSKDEANRRAEAILKKRSEGFVKGSGEVIGNPLIFIDDIVELKGLGKKFSKKYYLEKSTHTVGTSGYKTTFNVKDTTI